MMMERPEKSGEYAGSLMDKLDCLCILMDILATVVSSAGAADH